VTKLKIKIEAANKKLTTFKKHIKHTGQINELLDISQFIKSTIELKHTKNTVSRCDMNEMENATLESEPKK
jgi:hypothetical protein